jgi:hypothetical protein
VQTGQFHAAFDQIVKFSINNGRINQRQRATKEQTELIDQCRGILMNSSKHVNLFVKYDAM